MIIEIPGYKTLEIKNLLLDYNGTVAVDGKIPAEIEKRLILLAEVLDVYILTADTYGTVKEACAHLPVKVASFEGGDVAEKKQNLLRELGRERCATVGNGRNDVLMCSEAALSVAVIGREGASSRLLRAADIAAGSMEDGLDLFLKPTRIVAALRG